MDEVLTRVPVERLEVGLVLVPVRSPDGEPMTFVLDTGAGITVLSPRTAERLGVATGREVDADAVGGTVTVALGRLTELKVGDAVVDDLRVAVLELPAELVEQLGRPIDGILGRSFFAELDLSLDLEADELRLLPRGTLRRAVDRAGVRFALPGGVIRFRADLGDARGLRTVLDLGANRSVLPRSIADATGGPVRPQAASSMGADGRPVPLVAVVTTPITVAGTALAPIDALVCEDLQCSGTGPPEATLGVDAVAGCTLHVSYADRRLWIVP